MVFSTHLAPEGPKAISGSYTTQAISGSYTTRAQLATRINRKMRRVREEAFERFIILSFFLSYSSN
jgi:hypothetical protein